VTLIIFKFLDLRTGNIIPQNLCRSLQSAQDMASTGQLTELQRALRTNKSVLSRICQHALLSTHGDKASAERSTEAMAREEVSHLERGIPALEVIFTIAPMVGLIGTVGGLVSIFGSFGSRSGGPEQAALISKGISEALNTTIAGLAVAVPCYIFQSYFSRRLEKQALRMGTLTTGLISAIYRDTAPQELVTPPPPALPPVTPIIVMPQLPQVPQTASDTDFQP
jgi:biopolymer transport protein ExbB